MICYLFKGITTSTCTMVEGMNEPQLIPADNIRTDNNNETPNRVKNNLRPNSETPFTVNDESITLKFWFMPAIPIESVQLVTSDNVKSITVSYIKPESAVSRAVKVVTVRILYYKHR